MHLSIVEILRIKTFSNFSISFPLFFPNLFFSRWDCHNSLLMAASMLGLHCNQQHCQNWLSALTPYYLWKVFASTFQKPLAVFWLLLIPILFNCLLSWHSFICVAQIMALLSVQALWVMPIPSVGLFSLLCSSCLGVAFCLPVYVLKGQIFLQPQWLSTGLQNQGWIHLPPSP